MNLDAEQKIFNFTKKSQIMQFKKQIITFILISISNFLLAQSSIPELENRITTLENRFDSLINDRKKRITTQKTEYEKEVIGDSILLSNINIDIVTSCLEKNYDNTYSPIFVFSIKNKTNQDLSTNLMVSAVLYNPITETTIQNYPKQILIGDRKILLANTKTKVEFEGYGYKFKPSDADKNNKIIPRAKIYLETETKRFLFKDVEIQNTVYTE